jgi:hypothetical protein
MNIRELMKKPSILILISALIGFLMGLAWAYGISPVEWTDIPPSQLGVTYQEQYLRMTIDSYGANHNVQMAIERYQLIGPNAPALLGTIVANPGSQDLGTIAEFSTMIQTVAPVATPAIGGTGGGTANPMMSYLLIAIAVLVVGGVGYLTFRYLLPLFRRSGGGAPTPAQQAQELSRQAEMTDYAAMGEEPPIAQFMTTYVLGDDLFDDSFSIDTPAGEFMGECGVGISETIGVGEPKKVTAFELWLFDKNDIQTVTKVLMSKHAFGDPATYQRLENKGQPIQVEPGKQVVLETAALQLVATISDMDYGQGGLPEGSFFDRLTLEIAVWPKIAPPQ